MVDWEGLLSYQVPRLLKFVKSDSSASQTYRVVRIRNKRLGAIILGWCSLFCVTPDSTCSTTSKGITKSGICGSGRIESEKARVIRTIAAAMRSWTSEDLIQPAVSECPVRKHNLPHTEPAARRVRHTESELHKEQRLPLQAAAVPRRVLRSRSV